MTSANQFLIGADPARLQAELVTPALCLDLDVMTANLELVAAKAKAADKALRPHVKAHKCPAIALRQLEAGAIGLACATLAEAEVMARAGCDGLLLTSVFANPGLAQRVVALAVRLREMIVVVDSLEGVAALAGATGAGRPLDVLIDINVGQNRTGMDAVDDIRTVALAIAQAPALRLRGIQAYYGHIQGVVGLAERQVAIAPLWSRIVGVRDQLRADGHQIDIVTGSGTGTASIDLDGPFTELQTGSYVLMDKLYGRVETGWPLGQALSIAARVVSKARPTRAVLDAGLKAMATDSGPALALDPAFRGLEHVFLGDEHSALIGAAEQLPAMDALVHLVPPHCDPTMNLYSELHVFSNGILTDIWPIESSGYRR